MATTAAPAAQRVLVDPVKLEDFMTEAYVGLGMPRDDARIAAWGVVFADLRGHESHGVSNNVFGSYVPGLRSGYIKANPEIRILNERSVISRWDGDTGMGFVVGHRVMQWVIARAKEHGAAFAAVQNSRHYGMAQCYSHMTLEHDLIGFSLTNGVTPGVVPFQGRDARLGHQPDLGVGPDRRDAAVPARHGDDDGRLRQDPELPARRQADPAHVRARARRAPDERPRRGDRRHPPAPARGEQGGLRPQGIRPRALGRHLLRRPLRARLPGDEGGPGGGLALLRGVGSVGVPAARRVQGPDGRAPARDDRDAAGRGL